MLQISGLLTPLSSLVSVTLAIVTGNSGVCSPKTFGSYRVMGNYALGSQTKEQAWSLNNSYDNSYDFMIQKMVCNLEYPLCFDCSYSPDVAEVRRNTWIWVYFSNSSAMTNFWVFPFVPFSAIEKTELHKCYHLFSLLWNRFVRISIILFLADWGKREHGSAPDPSRKLIQYMEGRGSFKWSGK